MFGFETVEIKPLPGFTTKVKGEFVHSSGRIVMDYTKINQGYHMKIHLPAGLTGQFIWRETTYPLKGGNNLFDVE